jgi:hypothetical protein
MLVDVIIAILAGICAIGLIWRVNPNWYDPEGGPRKGDDF